MIKEIHKRLTKIQDEFFEKKLKITLARKKVQKNGNNITDLNELMSAIYSDNVRRLLKSDSNIYRRF